MGCAVTVYLLCEQFQTLRRITAMLKSSLTLTIMRAAAALRTTGDPAHTALAGQLDDALQADAAHRASVAAGQAKRTGQRAGRTPSIVHVVDCQPGPIAYAMGSKAAHRLLVDTLAKLGSAAPPTAQSLAVMLSRDGAWQRLVHTADGTVAVTVRRATAAEAAKLA
jgi:hypothetical protein